MTVRLGEGEGTPDDADMLRARARHHGISRRERMLVDEASAIEQEDARAAGALGYMASVLAQVTLPHKSTNGLLYKRKAGRLTLAVRGHQDYGVPFGSIPRVFLAWICTEAVRTQSPTLPLGRSASEFSRKLGFYTNGRDLGRLKHQSLALARAMISIDAEQGGVLAFEDIKIVQRGFSFWSDRHPSHASQWDSTLTLTHEFFESLRKRAVPIDCRVYHALAQSPLASDIYTWLTYRMHTLRASRRPRVSIPWVALKEQFGNGYADDHQGLRNFKKKFSQRLHEVLLFYREASGNVEDIGDSLRLTACRPHIATNNPVGRRSYPRVIGTAEPLSTIP